MRNWFIAFGGRDGDDTIECYKRYVSATPIKPMPNEVVIEVVDKASYDNVAKELRVQSALFQLERELWSKDLAAATELIKTIDSKLQCAAAEYVPAIREVFTLIDSHKKRLDEPAEEEM